MRRKNRETGAERRGNSEREDYKEMEKRLVKGNETFLRLHSSGSLPRTPKRRLSLSIVAPNRRCRSPYPCPWAAVTNTALPYHARVHIRILSNTTFQSLLLKRTMALIDKCHPWSFSSALNPDCVPSSNCPLNSSPHLGLLPTMLNLIYKKRGQKSMTQSVIP